MFAGAAREAVFSKPAVIRRVQADFVPVALKAGLVNSPPDNEEGRLYREIGRFKPAPQGICVVNSDGKVLNWALSFDDDKSVLAFLDHAAKRFAKHPDAKRPVAAERHLRFPGEKLDDVEDNGKAPLIIERHPKGKSCPATPLLPPGTALVRVFGRALGKDGKPVADTVRQEHYVEDRFHVGVAMQQALAKAAADSGGERFRVADDLARLLVTHAYLGQLDVNPIAAPGGKGSLKRCEFRAKTVRSEEKGTIRLRIEGESEAAGATGTGDQGDGRLWRHEVKLAWEGLIEMRAGRITRLLLLASGSEKLRWGNKGWDQDGKSDVTRLPGGHPIDLACGVRYGFLGEPVPAAQTSENARDAEEAAQVAAPDRRQLAEVFGPAFLVFRERVQKELALTAKQKKKLEARAVATIRDARQFFEKLGEVEADEREKEFASYRGKTQEQLAAFLEGLLEEEQLARLRQLELQQEGLFALGRPDVGKTLKISDEQREKFAAIVQQMQTKIAPLLQEAQSGKGNPEDVRPKVMKLRKQYEGKLEAILDAGQKKQWKALVGKPFDAGE